MMLALHCGVSLVWVEVSAEFSQLFLSSMKGGWSPLQCSGPVLLLLHSVSRLTSRWCCAGSGELCHLLESFHIMFLIS